MPSHLKLVGQSAVFFNNFVQKYGEVDVEMKYG